MTFRTRWLLQRLSMRYDSKEKIEAVNKWVYQFDEIELEVESLKHKIQTLQRLPRYKQTTPEHARKMAQFKLNLQQIEGSAAFAGSVKKYRRDLLKLRKEGRGKIYISDFIAITEEVDKARRVWSRWQVERFKSNWWQFPDLASRMFFLKRYYYWWKWTMVFGYPITYGRLPYWKFRRALGYFSLWLK